MCNDWISSDGEVQFWKKIRRMTGYIWNDVKKLKQLRSGTDFPIFCSWNIFPPLQLRCRFFPQKKRGTTSCQGVETWNRICRCHFFSWLENRWSSSMKTDQFFLLIGKWEGFPADPYPPTNLYCINFYYSPNHIRNAPHIPIIPVLKTQPSAYIEKPHHLRRAPELSMGMGCHGWLRSQKVDFLLRLLTFCVVFT